jgi:hypothetical protein
VTAQALEAILGALDGPVSTRPAAEEGAQPLATPSRTGAPLAVFTASQVIIGSVDPKGQRVSDLVNNNTNSYLALLNAEVQDLMTGDEPRPPVPELTMRKDLMQVVVPQDAASRLRPRVSTRRLAIEVTTGFFRVRGDLYRRDSDPSNLVTLMSGFNRQFLPLADATIEHLWHEDVRTSAPIVLVNAQHLVHWAAV